MNEKLLVSLRNEILFCKKELAQLQTEMKQDPSLERVYNKMIIKKAVLMTKYKKYALGTQKREKVSLLSRFFPKKRLISDYFKCS